MSETRYALLNVSHTRYHRSILFHLLTFMYSSAAGALEKNENRNSDHLNTKHIPYINSNII